jgi:hypothetical protein
MNTCLGDVPERKDEVSGRYCNRTSDSELLFTTMPVVMRAADQEVDEVSRAPAT